MQILTLTEAAEVLRVPAKITRKARWLREHLKRRGEELGQNFLLRIGVGEERITYRVDMDAVRLRCSELTSSSDRLAQALREAGIVGRRAMLEQAELLEELLERTAILAEAVRKLGATVGAVEQRLDALAPRRPQPSSKGARP